MFSVVIGLFFILLIVIDIAVPSAGKRLDWLVLLSALSFITAFMIYAYINLKRYRSKRQKQAGD